MQPNNTFDTDPSRHRPPAELYAAAHWFACRTRARAEKQVDRCLTDAGVESFLPLMELDRQWADRKKRVAFPLFSGYTFARFRLQELPDVVRVPGLVMVVSEKGYPAPVREEEIESVRRLVEGIGHTGEVPEPVDWWEPGTPIRVTTGPFRDMRGFLLKNKGQTRLSVRLNALKMAFSVQLDSGDLERLG